MCAVRSTKLYGLRIKKNQLIARDRDKTFLRGSWDSYMRPGMLLIFSCLST